MNTFKTEKMQRDCAIINKWYLKFGLIKREEKNKQSEYGGELLSL